MQRVATADSEVQRLHPRDSRKFLSHAGPAQGADRVLQPTEGLSGPAPIRLLARAMRVVDPAAPPGRSTTSPARPATASTTAGARRGAGSGRSRRPPARASSTAGVRWTLCGLRAVGRAHTVAQVRRAALPFIVVAFLLTGCRGDDEPSRSAEETAQAWVDALNAEDYELACELSVVESKAGCRDVMKQEPFGRDVRVEGYYSDLNEASGDQPVFTISSRRDRNPHTDGWTAYASVDFRMERHDDEYLVHWEASIIK